MVAETQVTQPKLTKAQLEDRYTMLGTFKTEYGSSAEGRRYNIWKMADIINGVKIEPGETWSINEEAGPRTYSAAGRERRASATANTRKKQAAESARFPQRSMVRSCGQR